MQGDSRSKWQFARCGDVIDVRDGTHYTPEYIENGIPFITSKNLSKTGIDFSTAPHISIDDHREFSRRSHVERGDILFAMIGTIGNPVLVETEEEFSIKNVALFKFAKSKVDPKYFLHLLESEHIKRQLDKQTRGGTQKFISLKLLRELLIPLPPLEEQRRIGEVLDRADGLRQKRRLALRKLDALLQSVFLDMFGDSVINPKGWKRRPLGQVAMLQRGFDLPVQDRRQGRVPIYAANGPVGSHDSYKVKGPGVVTGRSGTLGKVHYAKNDFWPLNTALWVKNFYGNEPYWVLFLLRSMRLEQFTRGVGVPTLNRNLVHVVDVPVPPMELQQCFAVAVESIERQIAAYRAHLSKLDSLFGSLQSRAFIGGL